MYRQCSRGTMPSEMEQMPKRDSYNLLEGMIHVKYWSLFKCLCLIALVFREFQLDLQVYRCMFPPNDGSMCRRPSMFCTWVLYWIGYVPFSISFPMCTLLLLFVLLSTGAMMCALFIGQRELNDRGSYVRSVKMALVIPMTFVEICSLFGIIYHSCMGVSYRFTSSGYPREYAAFSVIQAIVLIVAVLLNFSLHIMSCSFICQSSKRSNIFSFQDYAFGPFPRPPTAMPLSGNGWNGEEQHQPMSSFMMSLTQRMGMNGTNTGGINPLTTTNTSANVIVSTPPGFPKLGVSGLPGESASVGTNNGGVGYGRLRRALKETRSSPRPYPSASRSSAVSEYSQIGNYERMPMYQQIGPIRVLSNPMCAATHKHDSSPYLEVV